MLFQTFSIVKYLSDSETSMHAPQLSNYVITKVIN